MAEFEKEKNVLVQLTKARDAIRHKHALLREGRANLEKTLHETFKPIVDPLEKLVADKEQLRKPVLKKSAQSKLNVTFDPNETYDPDESNLFFNQTDEFDETIRPKDASYETAGSDYDDDDDTYDNIFFNKPEFKDAISGKYLRSLYLNRKNVDKSFGVRKHGDRLMIGDSPISFTETEVKVSGKKYPKSVGLMELLFAKEPKDAMIETPDRENYLKIMRKTNAYKKNYERDEDFKNKNSKKFKNFILPYIASPTKKRKSFSGEGILPRYKIARRNTLTDYVYWDDPNELVDRLRLLLAEQSAGNPSHVNEIHSIIEELREGGYIY